MDTSAQTRQIPWAWLLGGVLLGAVSIYYLDPDRGRRRRALVHDQWIHLNKVKNRMVDQKTQHFQNKIHGYWSRLNLRRSIFSGTRKSNADLIH
jgi:hypothetical protein